MSLRSLGSRFHVTFSALVLLTATFVGIAHSADAAVASCAGMVATITGTQGADDLTGTPGNDVIVGLGGNDTIVGLGGDDIICGGNGADDISGGPGRDTILGQRGRDTLRGDFGSDTLRGGAGNDVLKGGKGNDTLEGGNHRDRLYGNTGRDMLKGQNGNDVANGGGGNDRIFGGGGADELVGGNGVDVCKSGPGFGTAASCETHDSPSSPVVIADFSFAPVDLTVVPGTTVIWTNDGGTAHTTSQDSQDPVNRSWDSGSLAAQDSFAVTFDVADTYSYLCSIHPFMTATVTVSPGA
ncbi:MAG: hypothetical protein HKN91_13190 [Acidimicrobiia bacterium]|nr:hypothetical protein [Acidimicrobiia bacterium]